MDNLQDKWATYYGDRVLIEEDTYGDEVMVMFWTTGERENILREDLTDISGQRQTY